MLLLSPASGKVIGENLTAEEKMKLIDRAEKDDVNACVDDMALLKWSCESGFKDVEKKIVKRIIRSVENYKSCEELFSLIGVANKNTDGEKNKKDLVVGANSK